MSEYRPEPSISIPSPVDRADPSEVGYATGCKNAHTKRLRFYWTGRPCIRGHYAYRYTVSGACLECVRARRVEAQSKRKKSPKRNQRKLYYRGMPEYLRAIERRRLELDLSAQELSERAGLNRTYWSDLTQKRFAPTVPKYVALARVVGLEIAIDGKRATPEGLMAADEDADGGSD